MKILAVLSSKKQAYGWVNERKMCSFHGMCCLVLKFLTSCIYFSCEELTHWKRLWCWEELGAGGEGDDRGWDGWMASLTRWTRVWVNSGSWWWTGRPGMLRFIGSQRVGHDWATELNWTDKGWGTQQKWHSSPLPQRNSGHSLGRMRLKVKRKKRIRVGQSG